MLYSALGSLPFCLLLLLLLQMGLNTFHLHFHNSLLRQRVGFFEEGVGVFLNFMLLLLFCPCNTCWYSYHLSNLGDLSEALTENFPCRM